MKVVRLSLQDKFVLEFRKVAPFLDKGAGREAAPKKGLKCVVFLPGDMKLKKLDVSSKHTRHTSCVAVWQ